MKFIERNRKFYYNNLNSNNHHILKTQKDNYFDGDERNIKTTSVKIRINSQKKKNQNNNEDLFKTNSTIEVEKAKNYFNKKIINLNHNLNYEHKFLSPVKAKIMKSNSITKLDALVSPKHYPNNYKKSSIQIFNNLSNYCQKKSNTNSSQKNIKKNESLEHSIRVNRRNKFIKTINTSTSLRKNNTTTKDNSFSERRSLNNISINLSKVDNNTIKTRNLLSYDLKKVNSNLNLESTKKKLFNEYNLNINRNHTVNTINFMKNVNKINQFNKKILVQTNSKNKFKKKRNEKIRIIFNILNKKILCLKLNFFQTAKKLNKKQLNQKSNKNFRSLSPKNKISPNNVITKNKTPTKIFKTRNSPKFQINKSLQNFSMKF